MNYHQPDRKLNRPVQRRGFGITQTLFALVLLLVLSGIGYFFGGPITNSYFAIRRMVFSGNTEINQNAENAYILALQSENEHLKELLGRKTSEDEFSLAAVLVRPPQTPYDSLIIDAGNNMGLQVGDVIYAEMNFAIGRVVEVNSNTSVVSLFSSSNQKANVLLGSSTTSVTVEGRGGGNFYIKLPKNIELKQGDPVLWPDIETILLGSVDVVDSDDGDAYSHVYFKSPVNIYTLRYVQFKTHIR